MYRLGIGMLSAALLLCLPTAAFAQDGPAISLDRIRADVKYLASTELQGRGIGSRGEDLTIEHIARAFEKAGLRPAGDKGTFYQAVPLVMVQTGPKATLAFTKPDRTTIEFKLEDEFAGL